MAAYQVLWVSVFDLTFLLIAAPADAALSADFSGGDFSSQVIDKMLVSGSENWSLREPTENVWYNQLICASHLEISCLFITVIKPTDFISLYLCFV